MSRKIYIIIAVVLAAVLSVSTFFIIRNHIDSAKQNEVYDNLAEIVEDEPPKENEGVTLLNISNSIGRMRIWWVG